MTKNEFEKTLKELHGEITKMNKSTDGKAYTIYYKKVEATKPASEMTDEELFEMIKARKHVGSWMTTKEYYYF